MRRNVFRVLFSLVILIAFLGMSLPGGNGGLPQNPKVVPEDEFPDGFGAQGGMITIDLPDDPGTFNPIIGFDSGSFAVNSQLHGTLLEVKPLGGGRGIVEAGLAEAFEFTSDFREVYLYLRQGLRFSDGEPLTADDVVFTLNEVVFNPNVESLKALWKIDGKFPKVEKIDNWTIKITAESPDPDPRLLGNLSNLVVLPKHILEGDIEDGIFWGHATAEDSPERIVGTGPFRLVEYVPGRRIVVERNPYYWKVDPSGQRLPYLDGITFSIVSSDSERLIRFVVCDTDIYKPVPGDLPFLHKRLPRRGLDPEQAIYISEKAPTVGELIFAFNQDAEDPNLRQLFRDVRFRQAMSYALDRKLIIDVNWTWDKDGEKIKLADPRCSMGLAEGFWCGNKIRDGDPGDPDVEPPRPPRPPLAWCNSDREYAANLEEAARLLDEIGLEDTDNDGIREFPEHYPNPGRDVAFDLLISMGEAALYHEATIFVDSLKKIGIEVDLDAVSFIFLVSKLFGDWPPRADFEAVRFSLGGGGDPTVLAEIYSSCGALHFYRYSDCDWEADPPAPSARRTTWQERVDELFEEQAEEIDPEERQRIIKELQWLIAENVPVIWSVMPHRMCVFVYNRLANFDCDNLLHDATIRDSEVIYIH